MDNASKALVMAGGVIIAVAIISIAVYFYSSASGYASASGQMLSASQIQSFNRFYTAYSSQNGKIRMVDALNLLNRAIEDDVTYSYTGSSLKKISGSNGAVHYEPKRADIYLNTAYYELKFDKQGKVSTVIIRDNAL